MITFSRRSILSAIGATLPFGLGSRSGELTTPDGAAPVVGFRQFEEAVRERLGDRDRALRSCRVEVGDSEQIRAGVQGCHNDRPFAGFPAGHLRIVRTGSEPGPTWRGVRLYLTTVEVALTGGQSFDVPSRPLDFASIPPAPMVC